uniref:Uncharacterized protein n=1 Tax=Pseudomonas fluorescens (strain SBW25) TaxID=216595 RepID=A4V747_PSEFS|nr:hypothetical protein pQBR0326 [Pseudomonas fluorescens SBW25]
MNVREELQFHSKCRRRLRLQIFRRDSVGGYGQPPPLKYLLAEKGPVSYGGRTVGTEPALWRASKLFGNSVVKVDTSLTEPSDSAGVAALDPNSVPQRGGFKPIFESQFRYSVTGHFGPCDTRFYP